MSPEVKHPTNTFRKKVRVTTPGHTLNETLPKILPRVRHEYYGATTWMTIYPSKG
jgi:hypothetical protein